MRKPLRGNPDVDGFGRGAGVGGSGNVVEKQLKAKAESDEKEQRCDNGNSDPDLITVPLAKVFFHYSVILSQ